MFFIGTFLGDLRTALREGTSGSREADALRGSALAIQGRLRSGRITFRQTIFPARERLPAGGASRSAAGLRERRSQAERRRLSQAIPVSAIRHPCQDADVA